MVHGPSSNCGRGVGCDRTRSRARPLSDPCTSARLSGRKSRREPPESADIFKSTESRTWARGRIRAPGSQSFGGSASWHVPSRQSVAMSPLSQKTKGPVDRGVQGFWWTLLDHLKRITGGAENTRDGDIQSVVEFAAQSFTTGGYPEVNLELFDCRSRVSGSGQPKPRAQPIPAARAVRRLDRRCLTCAQTVCSAWPRGGERGGARACNSRCARIFSITGCSRIAAMISSSPPQFGQRSRDTVA